MLISVSTPWGFFRPKFLPDGVGLASGILQAIVRNVFADLENWIILIFDNFLVLDDSYADATKKLAIVLQRCQLHRLVLKMQKSRIGTNIVTFFGYEVKPGSLGTLPIAQNSMASMILPTSQKQMQSFLGAANFFNTHIPNYENLASSLYECTVANFDWTSSKWP